MLDPEPPAPEADLLFGDVIQSIFFTESVGSPMLEQVVVIPPLRQLPLAPREAKLHVKIIIGPEGI